MATTIRDVKLVYGGLAGDVTATPQGTSMSAPLASGVPTFLGTTQPVGDISWDLAGGPQMDPMDLNFGGTSGLSLPTLHQDYLPTGGINGGPAIRRNWFPGMAPGSSPLWVNEFPMPASRHVLVTYQVRQNAPMDSDGSNIKLFRFYNGLNTLDKLGSLYSGGGGGSSQYHTWKWYWELFKPNSIRNSGVTVKFDDTYHEYSLEVLWDPAALFFEFKYDGVKIFQAGPTVADLDIITPGEPLFFGPFVEQYSGVGPSVNTGYFDMTNFQYTALP